MSPLKYTITPKGGISEKMKISKSRKALSPVVASIILIAVTVAVSIAVAAWMGALTFGFMGGGESLSVGTPWGWTDGEDVVYVNVTNSGGSTITISDSGRIGNNATSIVMQYSSNSQTDNAQFKLAPNEKAGLEITLTAGQTFVGGNAYTIVIVTGTNHEFTTTGTVPSPS